MQLQGTKTIVWKGIYFDTIELLNIEYNNKISVNGHITGKTGDKSLHGEYQIVLDKDWRIESLKIDKIGEFSKVILRDNENKWIIDGDPSPDLDNCEYIDINITPFTNSLPINGLNLKENETSVVDVVYIDFLSGDIRTMKQAYTKLDERKYVYESLESEFKRILTVDNLGFVVSYPGVWERLDRKNFSKALLDCEETQKLSESARMYNQLLGSWEVQTIDYRKNDSPIRQTGEWHFAEVLEGGAIQDIFIVPELKSKDVEINEWSRYGTSIRMYIPETDNWVITWINPVTGGYDKLFGKIEGKNLVHEGLDKNGNLMRWIFNEIKSDSFHWIGEISYDKGKSWILEAEFFGSKIYFENYDTLKPMIQKNNMPIKT